jgi:HlyD family secretion protein
MLTDTPVNSASSQPAPAEPRLASTLVTTKSSQPALGEDLETGSPVSSPSKPPWWNWKWLMFILPPIFMVLGGPAKLMESLPSNSATKPLTQPVERKTVPTGITANGTVKAYRSINLSPKTAGVVKSLLVKEGDRVRQGQKVAMMDDFSLRGQLAQYQGQLLQQQANLQRLQAGNRPQDIAKAEAQLAEVKANLRQLQAGNRPQEVAQAAAKLPQATLKQRAGDWQRSSASSGQSLRISNCQSQIRSVGHDQR